MCCQIRWCRSRIWFFYNLINFKDIPAGCELIPGKAESFDVIYAIESFEHALHLSGAIQETYRVLRKNGKVVILDKDSCSYGSLDLSPWEKWFDPKSFIKIAEGYGFQLVNFYRFHLQSNFSTFDPIFFGSVLKK